MFENEKPSLNQLSGIRDALIEDYSRHLEINTANYWETMTKITLKQYKYLLFLRISGKTLKAINLMNQFGFKKNL
jgi:hypothetical protein